MSYRSDSRYLSWVGVDIIFPIKAVQTKKNNSNDIVESVRLIIVQEFSKLKVQLSVI